MERRKKPMIFLDTHIVVWLFAGIEKKLSKIAIQQIESNELLISHMVRLELQYLFEIKRITETPETIMTSLNQSIGLKVSEMKTERVFTRAIEYCWTRDVFDRLITAEADVADLLLITKDKNIQANYKKAIW
jgi:PIN domain nuclease of toxin-antitoxin system